MKRFHLDWGFIVATLVLAGFSLALIWSTNPNYLTGQVIFFITGYLLFFFFSQLDSETLYNFAFPFYLLSLGLLIITLVSSEIRGATRWINILGLKTQPSELVKPFIIVGFAYFIEKITNLTLVSKAKLIILCLLPLLIIFMQPDLGNVIIYLLFLFFMLFANQLNFKVIISFLLLAALGSPFLWNMLRPYQRERIVSFLSPENDPQGAGYNAIQAMIAVGSGRIFGQGLGRGTQSHLRFLPENHTDFIFASLSEELGLFGALVLLSIYGFILFKILNLAKRSTNKFNYLVIIGIFTQILSQVFINISMNIGIIPITGVTLPFVSSGGSSILGTFIALGMVVSLTKDYQRTSLVIS